MYDHEGNIVMIMIMIFGSCDCHMTHRLSLDDEFLAMNGVMSSSGENWMKLEIFRDLSECSNLFKWKQTTMGSFFTVSLFVDSCTQGRNKIKQLFSSWLHKHSALIESKCMPTDLVAVTFATLDLVLNAKILRTSEPGDTNIHTYYYKTRHTIILM